MFSDWCLSNLYNNRKWGGGANLTRETTLLADCGPWETNFVEIFVVVRPPPQDLNGVSYCYMDAVFDLVVQEDSATQFYEERLTVAPRLVQFV